MKKLASILFFCCSTPLSAQKLYVYPTTAIAPRGGYQTVTAIVNGVNDKTVTWASDGGTLVGTNPCRVNEPCTIALHATTPGTYHLTAASDANPAVTATSTITITATPTPVTTWPRLLITQANLPSLRAKATPGNVVYQALKNQAIKYYNTDNALPWSWSCKSGTGQPPTTDSRSFNSYSIVGGGGGTGNTSTITLNGTNDYQSGEFILLSGYRTSTFLNDLNVYVVSATGSQIVGNISYPTTASAAETGVAGISTHYFQYPENDAWYFAYMALMDPGDPAYNWACYAHDTAIYAMTLYPLINRGYFFPNGVSEWAIYSSIWATLGDWLRGSGAVTTSDDLATMRNFYSYILKAAFQTSAQNYPIPTNTYNSPAMFQGYAYQGTAYGPGPADQGNMRDFTGNNYSLSVMLLAAGAGLTFNDNTTDAPNIPTGPYNTCGATRYQMCNDGTAGSMRAYWNYLDGALLYDYWAHLEDPNVSWQAYQAAYSNLPTQPQCEGGDLTMHPCFGDGRDGGSAEGNWYQYSMYRPRYVLNMLHTAGMDDPILYGPQISVGTSSWWDLKYVHDLETLTGQIQQYVGVFTLNPVLDYIAAGDTYHIGRYLSDEGTEAALLTFDSETGRTDRANALKWINFNSAWGGPLGTAGGCTYDCGYDNNISNPNSAGSTTLDMFLSLPAGDPVSGTLPTDPRPSLPTDLFDGSFNQNGLVRTSWASSGSLLSYWFNNSMINHEYNMDGRFDIWSNGEYITKGRNEFNDYDNFMTAANMQNELGINNSGGTCALTQACGWWEMTLNGGQFPQDASAGLVTVDHSELPAYAAAIGNTTNAYNGGPSSSYLSPYNDVQSASRSLIFLRGANQMVYYDRAVVGHAASTQSLSQVTTGAPTITGNTASWLTRSATQKAYYTSLLPSGGTITNLGLSCPNPQCDPSWQAQDWQPAAVLQITPPGKPTSSQFLSVLEWGAAGFSQTSTTLVQSTAGQNFDGALVGSSLVMFMRNWPASFAGVTYPASGATTHYISDLSPNTTYAISGAGSPTSATTDTAGVLVFSAIGTGDIVIRSMARIAASSKSGITTKSGRTAIYAAGAVAATVVLATCAGRARSSRTKHTNKHLRLSNSRKLGTRESLTATMTLRDTYSG